MTDRVTGRCYSGPAQLVAVNDLINAGIHIDGIPEGHNPQHMYVPVESEVAEELRRRLATAGSQLPDHGVLVEITLTRHEAETT